MAMDLGNLNSLDFNSLGDAPLPVKGVIIGFVCVALLAAGYFLAIKDQQETLANAEQTHQRLRETFEEKQNKAVNLEAYTLQMEEMKEAFGTMLRQLPSGTDVADLVVDITQTGLASGLAFDLIKPSEKDSPREFYAELPIAIQVSGDYHQLGTFVSGVAALPRIVTIHDVSVTGVNASGSPNAKNAAPVPTGLLTMKATAKTYRYMDEAEIAAAAAAAAAEAKSKRRGR